jgi:FKBP-type peptidyl-prolyl cis-trans isomerase 2
VAAACSLQVIKGFDQAVTGLAVGESRKERIAPENAVSHAQGDCMQISVRPWTAVLRSLDQAQQQHGNC